MFFQTECNKKQWLFKRELNNINKKFRNICVSIKIEDLQMKKKKLEIQLKIFLLILKFWK